LISFGPYRLLVSERLLLRDDVPVQIGGRSLDLLMFLLERAGEVVSNRELVARVWPDVVVEDSNLRAHIAGLRKALGEGRDGTRYIANIPRRGYSFVAPIFRATGAPQEPHFEPAARARSSQQRSRLPARLERMVGRDNEVAALRADLLRQRFVTLVAAGGMGKTTLAVSVAHTLADEFPDSIFFVDLAGITDISLVAGAVAAAVGLAVHSSDALPGLLAFLESRRVLLVLDNCEHVISATAPLAERIYLAAPQVCILATSREPLRVEGEHIYPLMPLQSPDDTSNMTVAQALAYPAVQLFVERAAAGGNRLNLTDEDARVVATICRDLDGIALALELAAARVAAHGIRGTAELLDLRFQLLWQGRRTALPRHQTLGAMLDWSYNLLGADERRVLCRLAAFIGTFSLADARAVAGEDGTELGQLAEIITSLVAKSLVCARLGSDGRPRYRLLEVTRAYVLAKLEDSGEFAAILRRHARYYSRLEVSYTAVPLSDHLDNVRAALEWSFDRPEEETIGRDLVLRVAPVLIRQSLLAECWRWSERALATLPKAERKTARELDLLEALAICSMFTHGNNVEVQGAIERGLQLAEELGDRARHLRFLAGQNIFQIRVGDFAGALRSAEQSTAIAHELGHPDSTTIANWMLGVVYHLVGDQCAAQAYCESGLNRSDVRHGVPEPLFGYDHRIRALVALARTLWLRGAVDRAARVAQEAIDAAAALGQPVSGCISLIYCATVHLWRGDWSAAEELITQGLAESKKHSLGPYHAVCSGLKGELLLRLGDPRAAIDLLQRAFDDLGKERHVVLAPGCGTALAEALAAIGKFDEALAILERSIAQRDGSGASFDMPEMLRVKASILLSQPESNQARQDALTCTSRAMDLARTQCALSWELRIATAQAQFQPMEEGARQRLRAIRSQFNEGSGTVDLLLADRLLD
jgi:predicted ATPase/DNA-binding winged helix-turn-helix (wHTH) protein